MKKVTIVFILLVFLHPLFSDGLDVLSSNQEITAYKHMNIPVEPEDPQTPPSDPASIDSFRIIDPSSNHDMDTGESKKLTNTVLSEESYLQNKTFNNVFSWEMKGTVFKKTITVKFTFGPLSSESVPFSGNMSVQDKTKVIPYTITLASNGTTVSGISGAIGTTQLNITSSNYGNYANCSYSTGTGNTTYRYYLADKLTYSSNQVSITTSSAAISLTCDLFAYSSVRKFKNNSPSGQFSEQKNNYDSCNQWTRSGYASLVLGLNDNGYSWTETVNGESVTYKLERGSATYTANVVVEITVN